jgi:ABC-type multidrug transport system fused ATPase/permease subunit
MDRIMVLDRGRIVEQGPFSELTAAGGLFHQLVKRTEKGAGFD